MVDATGKITSYEGTVEDITDRKRSESERQVITEIVHAVSLTDNLEDLLRRVHSALQSVLSAENCFVALYEPSTGVFNFPFFADRTQPTPPPQMVWRSCAAYVYRAGWPMLIPPQLFYELVEQEEVESSAKPPASWLGVPLRATAGTIGVLVVQNYERQNAYSQRDLEFLSSVGDRIASAIERKRAEGRIRESEARLRVLIEQLPAVLWTVSKDCGLPRRWGGAGAAGLQPNQIAGMSLEEYFETSDQDLHAHRGPPARGGGRAGNIPDGMEERIVRVPRGAAARRGWRVQGAICTALDMTDRKELEERSGRRRRWKPWGAWQEESRTISTTSSW